MEESSEDTIRAARLHSFFISRHIAGGKGSFANMQKVCSITFSICAQKVLGKIALDKIISTETSALLIEPSAQILF